jgi:hypothetical protein
VLAWNFIKLWDGKSVCLFFMESRVQMTDEVIFITSLTIKNAIQKTYDSNSSKTGELAVPRLKYLKQLV